MQNGCVKESLRLQSQEKLNDRRLNKCASGPYNTIFPEIIRKRYIKNAAQTRWTQPTVTCTGDRQRSRSED